MQQWRPSEAQAAVTRAVDALGSLPVLTGTVGRVVALADDPESTVGDLVAVMEADEAFAANLLRFANSAHNARPIRAGTIRQAVTMVGRIAVKRLAVEAATYRFLAQVPGNGSASRGHLHVHAVGVGSTSAVIAEHVGVGVDEPHLAGLLHDVGKLVMPMAFGEQAMEDLATQAPAGQARVRAEREAFGIDHAAAGAVLARRWGLPAEVVQAVAFHHGEPDASAPTPEAACVQLANAVVHMVDGRDPDTTLISRALTRLGLRAEVLDDLAERALSGHGGSASGGLGHEVVRLEELARIDDLTGALNRRTWLRELGERIAAEGPLAVVVLDVDHFTSVNDRHGHRMGDLLLGEVARVMGRHGTVGRLGGDEFGLVVPGSRADGQAAARAVHAALGETLGESSGLGDTGVSVVAVHTDDTRDPEELLRLAVHQLAAG